MLVDKDYRQKIISNLKDPVIKAFWVHEYEAWQDKFRNEAIAPIQNKVGQFLSTSIIRNVVGQSKSTINIFDMMNDGKIFLVNVSKGRIGEDNSGLLGGMIITKIQLAAMERVRIPEDERKDFYLYVDEFQNFATDSFANILSEARKYRLNLTVAHQYTAQLENKDGSKVRDAVFGNVGTMIIFRVGADDADFLEKEFEPEFTAQDLVNLPNYNVYLKLMIDGVTSRPFSALTLPPMKVDVSKGVKEKVIESSRALYTKPRKEVEDEILRWSGMLQVGDGDAKYKADCSNCKKSTMVPFEPKEGRPVYCKECMYKIKSGELKPATGFVASRSANQEEKVSTAPLAALGIEFKSADIKSTFPSKNLPTPQQNSRPAGDFRKIKTPYVDKTKHSSPSPLLKGLLQKIGVGGKKEEPVKIEPKVESKPLSPVQKPISLSELKKPETVDVKNMNIHPSKEASEEKKASLKDLLMKASLSNHKPEVIPSRQDLAENKPKVEEFKPVEIKKEEIKIEEVKKEEERSSPLLAEEGVGGGDLNSGKPEDKNNSWQKRKAKKEVPEDVLRKVLE
jgi:CxxC-x17-CxxC domain-containing protein